MPMRAADQTIPVPPGKAIYQLVVEAKAELRTEQRSKIRYAFFRPVSIGTDDGHQHSAFTRDISEAGIGLIHNMDLNDCEVEISIPDDGDYWIRVRTRIVWCKACGEGWYISGGQFVGIASIGR
jgi:hypothetical protein